ncbi:E3 ubiquitin-protein ligase ptr1 (HECT-type E3 ubiquitin transferase ptr1) (Poly(A)+ RNA transport protein 1) [Durusdinium trenchii]|uniref:HECT-type E3 ubiquitin transferase n=1 Tax=Durusdinium trenchii TaxID=1381693 RepID=A0ABP0I1C5_9DINO
MKAAQFMQIKELEGLAPTMSVEEYVAEQVKAILTPQALDEVRAGFWSLVPATVVEDVTPSELRQIVCPTIVVREDTDMGLRQIFRVVFEDDVSECQPLVEAFHAVLDALSKDEKKKFLMFVTGIEVPPEPGTEQLTVQMPFSAFTKDEHVEMLGKLPQAHTCTNTLELPNYYESLQESGRYAAQEGKATRALMSELKSVMKATAPHRRPHHLRTTPAAGRLRGGPFRKL